MALRFRFEEARSPLLGRIHRPVAQVFISARFGTAWKEIWMLVDTGADYTILPHYLAQELGVRLRKDCKVFRTTGIGGMETVYVLPKLRVRLGKWERLIPVGFLGRDDIPPLLGRHRFLETFHTHLSKKHIITFRS